MKYVVSLLLIAAAAAAGYVFEPELRPFLTGNGASQKQSDPTHAPDADPFANPSRATETSPTLPKPVSPAKPVVRNDQSKRPLPGAEPIYPGDSIQPSDDTSPVPIPGAPSQIVLLMQKSIRDRAVSEFSYSDVTEWAEGPDEVVNKVTVQTGIIGIEKKSQFGSKIVPAKAYIVKGKVHHWVWVTDGTRIK